MDLGIKNKIAFVTGGSKGIGKECVKFLAKENVKVAFCGRNEIDLKKLQDKLKNQGLDTFGFVADLSIEENRKLAFKEVNEKYGKIDILVNNVGGGNESKGGSVIVQSQEDFKKVFDLNFYVHMELMKLVIPDMKKNKWGRVINISSVNGREYMGRSAAYMTAKSALIAITKDAAVELIKYGICVNSIAPGMILHEGSGWEEFIKNNPKNKVDDFIKNNLPSEKFGWPESVGATVAYLASVHADLISGACLNIDGAQTKSLI